MRATLDFLLHDWLAVETLNTRERFAEHSRETFGAVLDTCEKIAREKFAPFNRLADTEEPRFDGERVHLPRATHAALAAYVDSGMLAAAQDYELGGMQLPCVVEMAGNAFFSKASVAMSGYAMLTSGNASLLMAHGTPAQIEVFAKNELAGRWFGTMCLSEPQAGSSLSDVATRAVPDGPAFEGDPLGPRYRLKGNKMWISGGEHELTENIVHLVLAKIPGEDGRLPDGVKGLSLFVVPKFLVGSGRSKVPAGPPLQGASGPAGPDRSVGSPHAARNPHLAPRSLPEGEGATGEERANLLERNDVALAGLNHKLGYRGTTNALLNFGEGRFPVRGDAGAIGYLVGAPGDGLRCMFHMMNEARIGVGLGAVMLGYAGYEASLDYAKQRPQGRAYRKAASEGAAGPDGKDASSKPSPVVEHADVKRMLLAQKAYVEGGLALALYCARLVDEQHTGTPPARTEAGTLLEMLTPVAKSWPSEWCLEANSLAIQIHGGYGYTRDFPVEQYWRDNRLNMIHEGTHGIQALDLLGRKAVMNGGAGLKLLAGRIDTTIARAAQVSDLAEYANALAGALQRLGSATKSAWATGDPLDALANATPYLQAFGHTVIAWMWLELALVAHQRLHAPVNSGPNADFLNGKLAAARYFFRYELPKAQAWLGVVATRDPTCRDTDIAWF